MSPEPNATRTDDAITLERIITEGRMVRDESQMTHARGLVGEFVTQALDEGMSVSDDVVAAIKTRVAQIDQLISNQLNAILTRPSSSSSRRVARASGAEARPARG
jgi:type VI secretion system protein ImpC